MAITDAGDHGASPRTAAARTVDLVKTYGTGEAAVDALAGVTVAFERAKFTAVMGPSGSGKSTLMHCMAGLDVPTSGQAFVGDEEIGTLDDAGLTKLRRDRIGFVFQSFNLVPTLTAGENIALPADLAGQRRRPGLVRLPRRPAAASATASSHRPNELSGGQQQRVACARALDRPPGPRSSPTSRPATSTPTPRPRCSASCGARSTEFGQSIVMVTHDPRGAAYADRVVFLADGKVVGELAAPTADSVLEQMKRLSS